MAAADLIRQTALSLGARDVSARKELPIVLSGRITDTGQVLTATGEPAVQPSGEPVTPKDLLRDYLGSHVHHIDPRRSTPMTTGIDLEALRAATKNVMDAAERESNTVAGKMAEFDKQYRGPDGRSVVPDSRRQEVEKFETAQARKAHAETIAAFRQEHARAQAGIREAIDRAQMLPDEVTALSGGQGLSRQEHLLARIAGRLDESAADSWVRDRDFADVITRYRASQQNETAERGFIRTLESGVMPANTSSDQALSLLSEINKRRAARVPQVLKDQEAEVAQHFNDTSFRRMLVKV